MKRLLIAGLTLLASGLAVADTVSRALAALPARYDAALPVKAADLAAWDEDLRRFPPLSHTQDKIAEGNSAWLQRWGESAERVAPGDAEAWVRFWQRHLQYSEVSPAFCAYARSSLQGADGLPRQALSLPFAQACAQPADAALLLRDETPARALLAFYDVQQEQGVSLPYDPRLERAAATLIDEGEGYEQRAAAFVLAGLQQPQATAALLRIHAGIRDQAQADQVAMAFLRTQDPQGRDRAQQACARRPRDPMCSPDRSDYSAGDSEPVAAVDHQALSKRIADLAELGFTRVATLDAQAQSSADPLALLMAADYLYGFDTETGTFPNGHDSLLRRLARLASPALGEVVFEERYPPDDEGPYRLLAYVDGAVYQREAINYGDWYDVDAVLDLLGRLIRDQGLDVSLATLETGDQTALILAGPSPAVQHLIDTQQVTLATPTDAMDSGKAFEAEVLDQMQRGTLELAPRR